MDAILQHVRERTGLVFPVSRRDSALSAIRTAVERSKAPDDRAFCERLVNDTSLLDELVADLTIGESYFFRERGQFDFLTREVLPGFRKTHTARAWSAGCSTGEEAYSIAITLREAQLSSMVVGTDVSRRRLAQARHGVYRNWSLRGLHDNVIVRHFRKDGGEFRLDPAIRASVEFRYLNLASDVYPAVTNGIWGMDIVFCRNVLIYLAREAVAHVATRLVATLSENGWLMLGASDPIITDVVDCQAVDTGSGLAYRRRSGRRSAKFGAVRMPDMPVANPSVEPFVESQPVLSDVAADTGAERTGDRHVTTPTERDRNSDVRPPESPRALYATARYDILVDQLQRADRELSEGDHLLYIRSLANLGRLEHAANACARALDTFRTSAELHYVHAMLLTAGGLPEQGGVAARRALYLDRKLIVAHFALADALVRTGRVSEAITSWTNAERLLDKLPPDEIVVASDGQTSARLLQLARAHKRMTSAADDT